MYIDKSAFRHPGSIAHTHREREGREPMARLMQSSLPVKQMKRMSEKKNAINHTHTHHTTKTTVLRMTKMGGPGEKKKKRVQKVGSTFI